MNNQMITVVAIIIVFMIPDLSSAADNHDANEHGGASEENHGSHEEDRGKHEEGHDDDQSVKLTEVQIALAGIVAEAILPRDVDEVINAPGEIVLNAYKTTMVTPRVSSQVMTRHAKLGDEVKAGQPLLTLSSVDMASAQGELLISGHEWERVKKLGKKIVSAQRYTEARVVHQQARSRVLAYGMTDNQADALLKSGATSETDGSFQLLSTQDGTVIHDDFIVGELIEPGRKLFVISDESVLWVEAKLTPEQASEIVTGGGATITAGNEQFPGRVVQVHHALDEITRTLGVRVEVANRDDKLHPGIFVEVKMTGSGSEKVLTVPVDAVLRSPDGDWVVFTEHEKGEFEPQEIDLIRTSGEFSIIEGIEPGTHVVTQGAFFVQSELAKSGFEIHNH